jgi:hypothetical protein
MTDEEELSVDDSELSMNTNVLVDAKKPNPRSSAGMDPGILADVQLEKELVFSNKSNPDK